MFKGGQEKSKQLADLYEAVAEVGGAGFLNAGSAISTDGADGLHRTVPLESSWTYFSISLFRASISTFFSRT
jgi:hypothetical protein